MIMNEMEVAQQQEQRKREVQKQMAIILEAGIAILSFRLLTILAIFGDLVIFGWAMYEPRWERIVTATLFGLAMWVLTRFNQAGTG